MLQGLAKHPRSLWPRVFCHQHPYSIQQPSSWPFCVSERRTLGVRPKSFSEWQRCYQYRCVVHLLLHHIRRTPRAREEPRRTSNQRRVHPTDSSSRSRCSTRWGTVVMEDRRLIQLAHRPHISRGGGPNAAKVVVPLSGWAGRCRDKQPLSVSRSLPDLAHRSWRCTRRGRRRNVRRWDAMHSHARAERSFRFRLLSRHPF
jgi:hypothetical protein